MKRVEFLLLAFLLCGSAMAQDFWQPTDGLYGGDIRALGINASGHIFAGTWGGGVFLSTNNGTSWTGVNTGLTSTIVQSLAISGTNIFAGTFGGGVFLSTNNGTSWTGVNTGLTSSYVTSLAVSSHKYLFAGTDGSGVFRSVRPLVGIKEVEPNNTAAQANQITLGDIIDGAFSISGDVDYFKVNLAAGDTIDVLGETAAGSTFDGYLKLYDASGNLLDENDDFLSPDASRITYIIPTSGTYYIRYASHPTGGDYPNAVGKKSGVRLEDLGELGKATPLQKSVPALGDTGSYRLAVMRFRPFAPQVVTWGAYNIFYNSASFDGDLFPNGLNTTLTVEYGTTTSYGSSRTLATVKDIVGQYFYDELRPLSPNTSYNFRVVATNSLGRSETENQAFTTPPAPDGWGQVASSVRATLWSASFVDPDIGMIVGANGEILKTTDSGKSWTRQTSNTDNFLFGISMVTPNIACAVGESGTIVWTTDGGSTWVRQSSGASGELKDVCLTGTSTAVVVGYDGTILRTSDGGTTWKPQSSGTSTHLRSVDFADANLGVAVGWDGFILRTTDGGKTWAQQVSSTTDHLQGVDLVNANVGYAIGYNGVLLKTTNGGVAWTQQNLPTSENCFGIAFRDENNGIVPATGGEIWRTQNGGSTWVKEESGTWNGLYGTAFAGSGTLLVVGDEGTILRKTVAPATATTVKVLSPDGGEVWNEDLTHRIFWQASSPTATPISEIRILYSTDNGATYNQIFSGLSNTGARSWKAPRAPSKNALVKVVAVNSVGETAEDVSDDAFTIADVQTYVHNTGVISHTVRNDGFTGSASGSNDPGEPSLEFPPGSGHHYLYLGHLVLGAIGSPADTLANVPFEDAFFPIQTAVPIFRANSVETISRCLVKKATGIEIDQHTFAVDSGSYIVLAYKIYNKGTSTLTNAFLGLFCDFDLNDPSKNRAGYESSNKLAYAYDASGGWSGYVGMRMLNTKPTSFRRYYAGNLERATAGEWYKALSTVGDDDPSSDPAADYRVLESVGPVKLQPGDSTTIVIALAVGNGLSGVRNATQKAQQFWDALMGSLAPSVSTTAATNVTASSATLNGTVDPKGVSTTVYFEAGTTTSYGSTITVTTSPVSGTSPVSFSGPLGGLASGTLYHFRAVASNGYGTVWGADQSFTTAAAGTITVTLTPSVWATGFSYPLTWTSSNVTGNVNIRLSTNGGNTYTTILSNAPNTGSASVTIPASTSASTNCKLRVESVVNASVGGESGTFTIVSGSLPSTIQLSGNISFGSDLTASTSYRLVSLPGNVSSLSLSQILTGSQKTDWRMYSDNGASSNFLVELSGGSTLSVGEGYWLLKRGGLTISRSVSAVTVGLDATYAIQLHSGWNIIGNPFDKNVAWSAVLNANGITPMATTRIQDYNGSYSTSGSLDAYKGYYYFNSSGASSLKIPYPFGGKIGTIDQLPPVDWKIQLNFASDINEDPENFIGIAPAAKEGFDDLEGRKPPLFMDQGFLYFERPEWDKTFSMFSSDFRPSLGDGQVWDFVVRNPRKSVGRIRFTGIEGVSSEFEVKLVNLSRASPVDLRINGEYSYQATDEITKFKLVVGKKQFVEQELVDLIPQTVELLQNYPNPFNSSTTIIFRMPKERRVQLDILSVLGQRVRTLVDEWLTPGSYSIAWDGTDMTGRSVASGVYFYRLISEGHAEQTRKLTILK
jgi:photosystem II stability/assembly factor-like uncharacterized protein